MKYLVVVLILSMSLLANIGTITMLKGSATITREQSIFNAKKNIAIYVNDKIDTYKNSKLQIILHDDTTLNIGKNSEYIIESYEDTNNPHFSMRLNAGILTTITGKIGKLAPNKFSLKTKTSVIGIRGTKWQTYVGKKSENSICFEGEIVIKSKNKKFNLPAGYMLLMKDGKARKFKTNLRFFNSLIKKAQSLEQTKPIPTINKVSNQTINNVQIKNSNLNTNVKTNNVNISNNSSADVGNIQFE